MVKHQTPTTLLISSEEDSSCLTVRDLAHKCRIVVGVPYSQN
jgi:hypothetical protein